MNGQDASNKAITVKDLIAQAESLRASGQTGPAIKAFIQITRHAPRNWLAYFKLGGLLQQAGHAQAGLIALQRAADMAPEHAGVQAELGMALKAMGRQSAALEVLNHALALEPAHLYALFSKGELLLRMNQTEQALSCFEAVLAGEIDADNIKAISQWLRGVARLTLGDYAAAWTDYEARIHHPTTTFPELIGEKWTGQPLAGKTIFLAYEQRFGDVIQFSRFVPELVKQSAQVILQVPPHLTRLFKSLGPGIELINAKEALPAYDYCQLVTSIPAILNYRKDAVWNGPYLDVEPDSPTPRMPMRAGTDLKVGLVWAGKPVPDRSIPLSHYTALLRHCNVSFYSFQLGEARKQMPELAVGWLITDLSGEIGDFHDSSLLMKQMDLIITIDTAAAHQAGALGLPVWLMLIYYSDWRWDRYGSDTTAWYPSMRIFRQTEHDSWAEVARQLDAAFSAWVGQSSSTDALINHGAAAGN